jgi:hypothetical protein
LYGNAQASNNPPISPQDPSSLLRTYQYQLQNSKHPEFHLIYHRIPNTSNPKPNPRTSMRHLYNFIRYHIRHAAAAAAPPHHQTFRNNLSRSLDSFTTHPKKTPGNWKTLEFLPISKPTSQKKKTKH